LRFGPGATPIQFGKKRRKNHARVGGETRGIKNNLSQTRVRNSNSKKTNRKVFEGSEPLWRKETNQAQRAPVTKGREGRKSGKKTMSGGGKVVGDGGGLM